MPKNFKRVFSGVQPTGAIHLGNYLGAIKRFSALQNEYECIFCIVDSHAITMSYDISELAEATYKTCAYYLATGIDPSKSIIFHQSSVSAHQEMMWILSCIARYGWLNRMTQFKDKSGKNKEKSSVGLFVYPILMAADILAYRANLIPVGEDQKQHLELARDIAIRFNQEYKEFFPIPEALISKNCARIMSLRDGTKKMSKSEASDMSRINLDDDDDLIISKIKKSKTDPEPISDNLDDLKNRPEVNNLLSIMAALQNTKIENVVNQWAGKSFSQFKPALAAEIIALLTPLRDEYNRLIDDKSYLHSILQDGSTKAAEIALPNVKMVKELMGFLV